LDTYNNNIYTIAGGLDNDEFRSPSPGLTRSVMRLRCGTLVRRREEEFGKRLIRVARNYPRGTYANWSRAAHSLVCGKRPGVYIYVHIIIHSILYNVHYTSTENLYVHVYTRVRPSLHSHFAVYAYSVYTHNGLPRFPIFSRQLL